MPPMQVNKPQSGAGKSKVKGWKSTYLPTVKFSPLLSTSWTVHLLPLTLLSHSSRCLLPVSRLKQLTWPINPFVIRSICVFDVNHFRPPDDIWKMFSALSFFVSMQLPDSYHSSCFTKRTHTWLYSRINGCSVPSEGCFVVEKYWEGSKK